MVYAEGKLTVGLIGSGTGTIKSSDGLIECGTDCDEIYQESKRVTLKASPSENSYFSGWSDRTIIHPHQLPNLPLVHPPITI